MVPSKGKRSAFLSQEECEALLLKFSLHAMNAYRLPNKEAYQGQIDSLATIVHNLITHHQQAPTHILFHMEKAMNEAHGQKLKELDEQIKRLFKVRKQTSADTFYGEQEIIHLTTQIAALEEQKNLCMKETFLSIIQDTFHRAIKVHGTELPVNFNISQFESERNDSLFP